MRLEQVTLRILRMQLKSPFETSFGVQKDRRFLLVEVRLEGVVGLGEVTTFDRPLYNEEFTDGALQVLKDFLVPALLGRDIDHPSQVVDRLGFVRRHHMAKSGLEGAIWDAYARSKGEPLWKVLGGQERPIPVGVSIGLQPTPQRLVEVARSFHERGYRRLKLKIEPGRDLAFVAAVREALPEADLSVDANAAYRLEDAHHLAQLDAFGLIMVEQPLAADDLWGHAQLQRRLSTPICLDESITSYAEAQLALHLGSCRVVNIKVGRLGGLEVSRRVERLCREAGVPVWCGGMLESGVGRAHNVAIASLPGFTLPGDTSASDRYWHRDVVLPPVEVDSQGTIRLPSSPGIGYEPDWEAIEAYTEAAYVFQA
jgi:O-succinylbenzoate synthase